MKTRYDLVMDAIKLLNTYIEAEGSHKVMHSRRLLDKTQTIVERLISIEADAGETMFKINPNERC